jgi:hypothetical protein
MVVDGSVGSIEAAGGSLFIRNEMIGRNVKRRYRDDLVEEDVERRRTVTVDRQLERHARERSIITV